MTLYRYICCTFSAQLAMLFLLIMHTKIAVLYILLCQVQSWARNNCQLAHPSLKNPKPSTSQAPKPPNHQTPKLSKSPNFIPLNPMNHQAPKLLNATPTCTLPTKVYSS